MSESVRLSKRLAELVPCSRREAELYIEGGWVSVDGEVVEDPHFRVLEQQVVLHPEAVLVPIEPVTCLLNLPPDADPDVDTMQALIGADNLFADDPAGVRILKRHFLQQTCAAPLQAGASGLVVFSQDWRVLRKLNEDAHKNEQEYIVEVHGEPTAVELASSGFAALPAKVSWQNETRLRMAIKNPQPGQVVQLCESLDLAVLAMKRIRIGGVSMGKLPSGQWRYLAPHEKF